MEDIRSWGLMVVAVGLSVALAGCDPAIPVGMGPQPIAYNHQKHLAMGLECTTCHTTVTTKPVAGKPSVETCMTCHAAPLTDNPQEEIIRKTAEAGGELQWRQITLVPDFVYFSHARHVAVGRIGCEDCHGDMSVHAAPITRPAVLPSMEFCIECHSRRTVSVDCIACHR
ncbi:MAG: cytochrome c3 family protein [Nitrospinota bacterium]